MSGTTTVNEKAGSLNQSCKHFRINDVLLKKAVTRSGVTAKRLNVP